MELTTYCYNFARTWSGTVMALIRWLTAPVTVADGSIGSSGMVSLSQ